MLGTFEQLQETLRLAGLGRGRWWRLGPEIYQESSGVEFNLYTISRSSLLDLEIKSINLIIVH